MCMLFELFNRLSFHRPPADDCWPWLNILATQRSMENAAFPQCSMVQYVCCVSIKGLSEGKQEKNKNNGKHFFRVSNIVCIYIVVDELEDRSVLRNIDIASSTQRVYKSLDVRARILCECIHPYNLFLIYRRPPPVCIKFCDVSGSHLASAWLLQRNSFSIVSSKRGTRH